MLGITVDGVDYTGIGISGIRRNAVIREDNTSALMMSGRYRRGIVGTYYNYTMTFYVTTKATKALYDQLFEVLTSPQESHVITVPYGSTTLTFEAYVEQVGDGVRNIRGDNVLWGGMTVNFNAKAPQRSAEYDG